MPVAQGDVLEAKITYSVGGGSSFMQNVYYFQVANLVSADEADIGNDFFNFFENVLYPTISGLLTTDYTFISIVGVNKTKRERVFDGPGTFAGAVAADSSTPMVVAAEILARGRSVGHTGRKYIGPIDKTALTDGVFNAPAIALLEDFLEVYENSFTGLGSGNDYDPGTVSFAPGGGVQQFRKFVPGIGAVKKTARTQSRRTPGFGIG